MSPFLNPSIFRTHNEKYNAWAVANVKKIEPDGKFEHKQYNQNYPFDLETVLNKYSITELGNKEHKERLLESLQRGNLQSVTFIGENKQKEKLFITPNIPLNALRVYDGNKQVVTTEQLVEKGFIGREFADKLKETVEQLKQKNGNEVQQKQAPVQANEGKEKQAVTKEEKEGETAAKENRHRQTNKQSQSQKGEKNKHRQRHKVS